MKTAKEIRKEWLNEIEGFSLRAERFYDEMEHMGLSHKSQNRILEWIDGALEYGINVPNKNGDTMSNEEIHPAPGEFKPEEIEIDEVLRFFHYSHLPEKLQLRSKPFCMLAREIVDNVPRNDQRTIALSKLLEAKDAAVRAAIPKV